eukprot:407276-Amphidinium_carterae.3
MYLTRIRTHNRAGCHGKSPHSARILTVFILRIGRWWLGVDQHEGIFLLLLSLVTDSSLPVGSRSKDPSNILKGTTDARSVVDDKLATVSDLVNNFSIYENSFEGAFPASMLQVMWGVHEYSIRVYGFKGTLGGAGISLLPGRCPTLLRCHPLCNRGNGLTQ